MKSKLFFTAVGIAFGISSVNVYAQNMIPCNTSEILQEQIQKHPDLLNKMAEYQKYQADYAQKLKASKTASSHLYVIPVVFHVIHNYGGENIADAQIIDAVSILNRDFKKLNADTSLVVPEFKSIIADCQFEFILAKKDPNGNCTNGIERIQSLHTNLGDDASKINQWPRDKYLNIWVVASIKNDGSTGGIILGNALFPASADGYFSSLDGIRVIHNAVGSIGTGSLGYSRTLTHEVGHYLGLAHPWGSTNPVATTCGDDGIADTPKTKGYFSTCPTAAASKVCDVNVVENYQNYMDYSSCTSMFTFNQKSAMVATLNSSVAGRNNLWTAANLLATGVDGSVTQTCVPKADFYSFGNLTCTGVNVLFYDVSWNAQVDNRSWTFSNATPSTSTSQNVTVMFNSPGWQTVSLTVSNANGSDTKTVTKQMYISDASVNQRTGSIIQDFENKTEFENDWIINNQPVNDNNPTVWQLTNAAATSGTTSLMLNSYVPSGYPNYPFRSNNGDIDEFVTPSVDLTGVTPLYLSFRYAYATKAFKSSNITESLKIYYSATCGKTWNLDTTLSGGLFANAGSNASAFVPTPAIWKTRNVKLSPIHAKSNIRFKFQYNSGDYSNNLYIDDINIGSVPIVVIGINENETGLNSLSVYPNPANESATITYQIYQKKNVELSIYNILGNKVMTLVNQSQDSGEYAYNVNKLYLAKGMYFIQLNVDNKNSAVKKFILLD